MTDKREIFTPAEAADYLTALVGRKITVARLAQLRRAGRVKATSIGYNTTIYNLEDLRDAATSLRRDNNGDDEELEPVA